MFGHQPEATGVPPPPPNPPQLQSPSLIQAGTAERTRLNSAEGQGFNGTDVTGGQGLKAPTTTKSLLG